MSKSVDVNLIYPPVDFLNIENLATTPICKRYHFSFDNKQVCIHRKHDGFHVMCFNWIPRFLARECWSLDKWYSIGRYSTYQDAIPLFRQCIKEILRIDLEARPVTLSQIINDLCMINELQQSLSPNRQGS